METQRLPPNVTTHEGISKTVRSKQYRLSNYFTHLLCNLQAHYRCNTIKYVPVSCIRGSHKLVVKGKQLLQINYNLFVVAQQLAVYFLYDNGQHLSMASNLPSKIVCGSFTVNSFPINYTPLLWLCIVEILSLP